MFVVYEGDNRCSSFGFVGFGKDYFETKEESEIYMIMYAYPVSKEQAVTMTFDADIGKQYDMSMGEWPVWMSIREE